jgi:MOSC domain-containing protein YiiM
MLGGLTLTLSFTGGGFFLGVFSNASTRKLQSISGLRKTSRHFYRIMKLGTVNTVLIGQAAPYTRAGSCSAINKKAVAGTVTIHHAGLDGDEQGDRRVHGGPDKAVHVYPIEHYSYWRSQLGAMPLLKTPGAFGENLSTEGVTENGLCLGDQLRIGSVLFEISQSRQPCWKLNDRFGVCDMALRVQKSLRTGFYCRVLESGTLAAGDKITLIARPYPEWTLWRLMELLYYKTLDFPSLKHALELPLTPPWRKLIENRLASGQVEDWGKRMNGPSGDHA